MYTFSQLGEIKMNTPAEREKTFLEKQNVILSCALFHSTIGFLFICYLHEVHFFLADLALNI